VRFFLSLDDEIVAFFGWSWLDLLGFWREMSSFCWFFWGVMDRVIEIVSFWRETDKIVRKLRVFGHSFVVSVE
jgi:hypothetical protein